MSKTRPKFDLKNSWNWRTTLVPATVWQILSIELIMEGDVNFPGKTCEIISSEIILWLVLSICNHCGPHNTASTRSIKVSWLLTEMDGRRAKRDLGLFCAGYVISRVFLKFLSGLGSTSLTFQQNFLAQMICQPIVLQRQQFEASQRLGEFQGR